jgi:hypothetical protein
MADRDPKLLSVSSGQRILTQDGMALALVGSIFIALGITFLSVIGILIAIPVMMTSYNFLNPKLSADTVAEEAYAASSCYCT